MPIQSGKALSGIHHRLYVTGIPSYTIKPFADLIVKWATCSGDEWTVSRLKDLKISLIRLRAGLPITAPIARNRKREVRGVVGSLMRWGLKSDKNFVRVLSAFMAYSHFVSCQLTSKQRRKLLGALNTDPAKIPVDLAALLQRTTDHVVGRRLVKENPTPLLMWQGSSEKRAPTVRDGSVPQDSKILYELLLTQNNATWDHILRLYEPIYRFVFNGLDVKNLSDSWHYDQLSDGPMIAGEVHFLQEPGYKLRSIASPYRLFQVASEPLKNTLKGIVEELPWDCTHDQQRAIPVIQERLKNRDLVYSIDLTSATDIFPWELQDIVLTTIFGKDNPYIQLFREISRAKWKSEIGLLEWRRGQPLGFNPSFFTFTLTHGLLLESIRRRVSPPGQKFNNEFFVVGDDVVIMDRKIYDYYIMTLKQLGCPYSSEKSLISDRISEFAGKVVTDQCVFPQLKWRAISDDNFLDLARLLGQRIYGLLSPKQQKVVDMYRYIPSFLHPYGLDWSYPGSNLSKKCQLAIKVVAKEEVVHSLTGLCKLFNKQFYAVYGSYTADLRGVLDDSTQDLIATLDQRVVHIYEKLGIQWLITPDLPASAFKDIPWALRHHLQDDQLPCEHRQPSRLTLLQRILRTGR